MAKEWEQPGKADQVLGSIDEDSSLNFTYPLHEELCYWLVQELQKIEDKKIVRVIMFCKYLQEYTGYFL